MLSRWTYARLRSAERALNAGRIDEAFERLTSPDIRNSDRAGRLLDELARRLAARARLAAQAGDYARALPDLARLKVIGRCDNDAQALRDRLERELRAQQARQADQRGAYHQAARSLEQGRLESGRLALDRLEDDRQRRRLSDELRLRERRSYQLLEQARAALSSGDPLLACRFWHEASARHGRTSKSDALAVELAAACRMFFDEAFDAGRLDRLSSVLEAARHLRDYAPNLTESEHLFELARRAAEHLAQGESDLLRQTLLRLQAARGTAHWVRDALESLDQLAQAQGRLLASPLGLLSSSAGLSPPHGRPASGPLTGSAVSADRGLYRIQGASLSEGPQLLLVDGTGSVLLTASDQVRIGRAGVPGLEVPIPADILSHHADIARDGEDYFLLAHGPVQVNQRPVGRTLLRHGDRIVLGSAAKLVFCKPSVKSDTAVLKLSSRCRLPQDVSLVVLFRGTCLLGPQASCHVQTREGDTRLVLFDRAGELFVRRAARDGRPTGPAEPLPALQTCEFGDLRLTVKAYDARVGSV